MEKKETAKKPKETAKKPKETAEEAPEAGMEKGAGAPKAIPEERRLAVKNVLARVKYQDYMDSQFTEISADTTLAPVWAVKVMDITMGRDSQGYYVKRGDKRANFDSAKGIAKEMDTILKGI